MPPRQPHSTPGTLALGTALERSAPLAVLLQRLQQSRERFADIRERLPPGLRDSVRPGPLDERGWTLLAPDGAAASKLRQLLPELEAALQSRGWPSTPLRVRVQAA